MIKVLENFISGESSLPTISINFYSDFSPGLSIVYTMDRIPYYIYLF